MEPLTQRVPACPVWTNTFANRCPSPADKMTKQNFLPVCSHKKTSFLLFMEGGKGAEGEGGLWKDRFKLPASHISVFRPFFLFFLPLI